MKNDPPHFDKLGLFLIVILQVEVERIDIGNSESLGMLLLTLLL